MKVALSVIAGLLAVFNANAQRHHFKWLVGTWEVEGMNVYEVWTHEGKDLGGKSFSIKGADTVVTETITLKFFNGSYHYIPDVAGEQPPIDFRITSFDRKSFVAENPQHDFPKIIRYQHVVKDSGTFIRAAIEGNGKVIPYWFRKLK